MVKIWQIFGNFTKVSLHTIFAKFNQTHNQMFYVQLFDFKLYSVKLLHIKAILITSNMCGQCQMHSFQFKLKPTIKCVKCKYKSCSQLSMCSPSFCVLTKIFARPIMAYSNQNNNYCDVVCIYDWQDIISQHNGVLYPLLALITHCY